MAKWLKIWWLGGDLNTRPRDYDFYAVFVKKYLKPAIYKAFSPFPLFLLVIINAVFLTQKSAHRELSLKVLTVQEGYVRI